MGIEAVKLELIQWLANLEDSETLEYLKLVKDSGKNDWWDDLTDDVKSGIERGLKDIDAGHLVAHEEVKKKYGL
jgi:hypothetical protein